MVDLFTAFGSILTMCADRGYEIPASVDAMYREERNQRERGLIIAPRGETLHPITAYLETGRQQYGAKILFQKPSEIVRGEGGRSDPDFLLVFFSRRSKSPLVTNLTSINEAIREMSMNPAIKQAIIVIDREILSFEALKAIKRLSPTVRIKIFYENDL